MEPLLRQLRSLPDRFAALPGALRLVLLVAALAGIGVAAWNGVQSAEAWQYAFTNLTPEDSSEAAAALKAAGVPFRVEAGGSALAVPGAKVYDARLLLAAAGLPRGGGVGFEIFDRGDLGISEFTQRVNLRRATEGELARTIGRLSQVRTARVHLTLPERGLFRDEDRKASAAVVLGLQPGRTLEEREIAGVRHLVASAVPGLAAAAVTVVDGRGTVLSASDSPWGEAQGWQRRLEGDLQKRVVDLLEQAVGAGSVVARVTATVDATEVSTQSEQVDPESSALKSERRVSSSQSQDVSASQGVAGAAANQPLQPQAVASGPSNRGSSSHQDEIRNFEVSRTSTHTVTRTPRLKRLSVAVLLDGVDGKPRPDAEVARLGELAKRAVGFDASRGDVLDISSAPFVRSEAGTEAPGAAAAAAGIPPRWLWAGGAAAAAVVLLLLFAAGRRGGAPRPALPALPTGVRIAEVEAGLAAAAPAFAAAAGVAAPQLAPADPAATLRDRARDLAAKDPNRAAHILKAWMQGDPPPRSPVNG
jgi:flagellar M-ring protein FliF